MILLLCGHDLDALVFHLLAPFGVLLARYGVEVALYLLIFVQINQLTMIDFLKSLKNELHDVLV